VFIELKINKDAMNIKEKIRIVVKHLVNFKKEKILYLICHPSMVAGLWENIVNYGIEFNAENHEIVVDIIQDILLYGADVEYEWSKKQYEAFVKFNPTLLIE